MKFEIAYVKTVKADVAKREITIALVVEMDEENLALAEQVARFAVKDAGSVMLEIDPRQMTMSAVLTTHK